MRKPLNGPEISPDISPGPDKRPRKRPAAYLGVTCERSGPDEFRLRWVDAESGKRVSERLPPGLSAKERELRRRDKAADLIADRKEIKRHADRKKHGALTVAEALAHYFRVKRPSPKTAMGYRPVAESFRIFCETNDVDTVRDLRRLHLRAWRAERLHANKLTAKPGGKRGERQEAGPRSVASANRELRALSAILNFLRDEDVIRLSSDEIRTGLAREKQDHELRTFLKSDQVRALLRVAAEHDSITYRMTRGGRKDVVRYKPIAPMLRCLVLCGLRLSEALDLQWEHVHHGAIHLPASIAKGGRARVVSLLESPTALPARAPDATGSVFGLTEHEAVAARKRLLRTDGAPEFDFHTLRRTCATFSVNAPGLYGGAGIWLTAKRLGHSPAILEKHYAGLLHGIDPDARSLEAVLQLDEHREAALQREQQRAVDASSELASDAVAAAERNMGGLVASIRFVPPSGD